MRFLLLILLFCVHCSLDNENLSQEWEVLETDSDTLLDSVILREKQDWAVVSMPFVPGFTKSAFWVRAKLENLSPQKRYYLVNPVAYVERIDFFYVQNEPIFSSVDGSAFSTKRSRYKKFPYPYFHFRHISGDGAWIYVRYSGESSIYMEPMIFNGDDMANASTDLQMFHVIFISILGFTFVLSFSQYIKSRNTTFLFYALHIMAVVLYQIAYTGLGKVYLWNEYPDWNRRSLVVFGSVSFFALCLFSIRFFQMSQKSQFLFRILVVLMLVICITGLLGLYLPISVIDPITHLVCSLTAIILLGSCIHVGLQGIGYVRFYLVAISFLIVSIMGFNLFAFGILGWEFLRFSIEIGTLAEILVFNLAIRDKFSHSTAYGKSVEIGEVDSRGMKKLPGPDSKGKTLALDRTVNLDKDRVYRKLDALMEEKIFCDEDLSLERMSKLLDIRPDQLSYLINRKYTQNFNQFVNGHRIAYAKDRLLHDRKRSVLDIAFESGFNSKSSFHSEFRRIVGMTPSEFRMCYKE